MKWIKKDRKAMVATLRSWLLLTHGRRYPDRASVWMQEHLAEIIVAGLRDMRGVAERYLEKDVEAAAHYRAHPEIYGAPDKMIWDSDLRRYTTRDEAIELVALRFDRLADERRKAIAYQDRLIVKVQSGEPLPEGMIEESLS